MTNEAQLVGEVVVPIYPELLAEALRHREEDLYFAWSILRTIGLSLDHSGVWPVKVIQSLFVSLDGIGDSRSYDRLNAGAGRYWHLPGGKWGQRRAGVRSLERVADMLRHQMPASRFFRVSVEDLLAPGTRIGLKRLAVQMVAGRHTGEKPVALRGLVEDTGLSRSTVKRFLRRDGGAFRSRINVLVLYTFLEEYQAQEALRRLVRARPKSAFKYFVVQGSNQDYYLVERKPNSYFIGGFVQGEVKERPKVLRAGDFVEGQTEIPQVYCAGKYAQRERAQNCCVPMEVLMVKGLGTIRVWQPMQEVELPEGVLAMPPIADRSARIALEKRFLPY